MRNDNEFEVLESVTPSGPQWSTCRRFADWVGLERRVAALLRSGLIEESTPVLRVLYAPTGAGIDWKAGAILDPEDRG